MFTQRLQGETVPFARHPRAESGEKNPREDKYFLWLSRIRPDRDGQANGARRRIMYSTIVQEKLRNLSESAARAKIWRSDRRAEFRN